MDNKPEANKVIPKILMLILGIIIVSVLISKVVREPDYILPTLIEGITGSPEIIFLTVVGISIILVIIQRLLDIIDVLFQLLSIVATSLVLYRIVKNLFNEDPDNPAFKESNLLDKFITKASLFLPADYAEAFRGDLLERKSSMLENGKVKWYVWSIIAGEIICNYWMSLKYKLKDLIDPADKKEIDQ